MAARTPINDEPDIDINLLPERQRLLKKLVKDIRECSPPMVFGVHGDWGAGKTSFLQAVMFELTGSCPSQRELPPPAKLTKGEAQSDLLKAEQTAAKMEYDRRIREWKDHAPVAIWFEAWRYQNEPAPVIALLHELRAQLSAWVQAKNLLKQTGAALWRNSMLALDSIKVRVECEAGLPANKGKVRGEISPFHMAKSLEEVRAAQLATPLPSNQLREALDEVLEGLFKATTLQQVQHRIVIFIDDLDRCSATSMFSLLESIKIYLNLKHCVFVLGINRHELERNIASILPEPLVEDQRQVRAHEYIEKLCGNMLRLPYASPGAVVNMVEKWLEPLDGIVRKKGIAPTRNDHSDNRDAILALIEKHRFLPLNPRRIKMWSNTVLQLYENRAEKKPNGEVIPAPAEQIPALVLIACLHTFYPALHQSLASATSFLLAIKKWSVAEHRFEPELDVFECVMRVFVMPKFIAPPWRAEAEAVAAYFIGGEMHMEERHQKKFEDAKIAWAILLKPILKRAYGWAGDLNQPDDKSAEGEAPKRIPLLTDPSSLHYFHPQSLVADETITEEQIRPYLHLD